MQSLHSDVIKLITGYLDDCSKAVLSITCKKMHTVVLIPYISVNDFHYSAIQSGHLTYVKWTHSRFQTHFAHAKNGNTSAALRHACAYGQIHIAEWLLSRLLSMGCELDVYFARSAAYGGHLDMLKWLREVNCPFEDRIHRDVADGGHLDMLKWLGEVGFKCDSWTYVYAISSGHLHVMKWLKEIGCPYDIRARLCAMNSKRPEIVQWAWENMPPQVD